MQPAQQPAAAGASAVPQMPPTPDDIMGQQQGVQAQPEMPADVPMEGDDTLDDNAQPVEAPEEDAENTGSDNPFGVDDSTGALFQQLDAQDKETARKYIISMLNDNNGQDENEGGEQQASEPAPQQEPVQQGQEAVAESIEMTKKKFTELCEKLGSMSKENTRAEITPDKPRLAKHSGKTGSPFVGKKFKK